MFCMKGVFKDLHCRFGNQLHQENEHNLLTSGWHLFHFITVTVTEQEW